VQAPGPAGRVEAVEQRKVVETLFQKLVAGSDTCRSRADDGNSGCVLRHVAAILSVFGSCRQEYGKSCSFRPGLAAFAQLVRIVKLSSWQLVICGNHQFLRVLGLPAW
jgi:hypothetical protein